jgi:hypothetical protein
MQVTVTIPLMQGSAIYIEQIEPLLRNNLEAAKETGAARARLLQTHGFA